MPTKQRKIEVHRLTISGLPEGTADRQTTPSLEALMPPLLGQAFRGNL